MEARGGNERTIVRFAEMHRNTGYAMATMILIQCILLFKDMVAFLHQFDSVSHIKEVKIASLFYLFCYAVIVIGTLAVYWENFAFMIAFTVAEFLVAAILIGRDEEVLVFCTTFATIIVSIVYSSMLYDAKRIFDFTINA